MSTDFRALLSQALLKLEEKERELRDARRASPDPVAIIGLGCRFPGGADDPSSYWRMLSDGVDAISEVPADRWDVGEYYDPEPDAPGKIITRHGGFIRLPRAFDAKFFGIAPREAATLDPQQRLLLEVTWEALEDAGIPPPALTGSNTGVFIGISAHDNLHRLGARSPECIDAYLATGNLHSVASGRLSYQLGLQGPSMSVDTACSSSLVAVHLACQSLRAGECDLAIVGGVNQILSPMLGINFSQAHMLSPDGRCKTFDAAADGFVRSEGCGVIILRRLRDAREQGEQIRALLRGGAINQDGRTSGLTVPNGRSQQALIRAALKGCGLAPGQVDYVEAHGTGTTLGDPIEVEALAAALAADRASDNPLWIGSVKTNIGHLEAAAGIAGLMKVVLALQHEEIPPHLHVKRLTPHIDWDAVALRVPTRRTPWPRREHRRTAGVSSFGFSGTNAHIILEEAPDAEPARAEYVRPCHLLALSAKSAPALETQIRNYARHLEENPSLDLGLVCTSANRGRAHFEHRAVVLAETAAEAREKLALLAAGKTGAGAWMGAPGGARPGIVFLFTGQGAQYAGMGRELYETQPVFRAVLDRCEELLRPRLERPLLDVIYPESRGAAEGSGLSAALDETIYTQPALYAIEVALAELWKSWGIEPAAVLGHSVGEYAAGCVAGIFSLEDGLHLIAERARMVQELPAGGVMMVVDAPEQRTAAAIASSGKDVSIAAVNGPRLTVLSGRLEDVQSVVVALAAEGFAATALPVSHAFHSRWVEPMLEDYGAVAARIRFSEPRMDFVSSVTGALASGVVADAAYWTRQVRNPVQFMTAMQTLVKEGYETFVEIGPKPSLLGMGREIASRDYGVWLPSLRERLSDWRQMLTTLGRLYVQGAPVNWEGVDRPYAAGRQALPTYPWQRELHWVDVVPASADPRTIAPVPTSAQHPLLGSRRRSAIPRQTIEFESALRDDAPEYLADHRVFDEAVLPAAAFLETFLAAGSAAGLVLPIQVSDVSLMQALVLSGESRIVQCQLTPAASGASELSLYSCGSGDEPGAERWIHHASGTVRSAPGAAPARADLARIQTTCSTPCSVDLHYDRCRKRRLEFGPAFRLIDELWSGPDQGLGRVNAPEQPADRPDPYWIHPALLDGCFQVLLAGLRDEEGATLLPVHLERMTLRRKMGTGVVWSHVRLRPEAGGPPGTRIADVRILDPEGAIVAEVEGLMLKPASEDSLRPPDPETWREWLYEVDWRHRPRVVRAASPEYLPSPRAVGDRLRSEHDRRTPVDQAPRRDGINQGLESAGLAYILEAFGALGLSLQPGERIDRSASAQRLGVVPEQHRLYGRLLEVLAEEAIVAADPAGGWIVAQAPDVRDAAASMQALGERHPNADAELSLLRICGPRLAEVLSGACDPVQLLFPGGDVGSVTYLYEHASDLVAGNRLIQQALASALEALPADRTVRILEVGAGTGATTSGIVPYLPASQVEYVFTDVSAMFTSRARERFKDLAFMRYEVLDIEEDPVAQGFEPGSADIVIAANVLHATRDLKETVTHIRTLLAPGGMLLLLEGTEPRRWVDLTFGLLEGWWRFVDHALRPSYPLIDPPAWKALLSGAGYDEIDAVETDERDGPLASPQCVIAARRGVEAPAGSSAKRWLIFADRQGVGEELAGCLRAGGDGCTLVYAGEGFERRGEESYWMDPDSAAEMESLLAEQNGVAGVVHLWSVDAPGVEMLSSDGLSDASRLGCGSVLNLVQGLVRARSGMQPGLWLVTRGAVAVDAGDGVRGAAQACLWGMGKAIGLEHPELRCVRVDLDPDDPADAAEMLAAEISGSPADAEDHLAFRRRARYAARLVRFGRGGSAGSADRREVPEGSAFALESTRKGALENLAWAPAERRLPQSHEVEIRVCAVGLNFIDVLDGLGMLGFSRDGLGLECAGEISAVGEGVDTFQIGDEVVAIAEGCLRSHVLAPASLVVKKPETLSMEQAASIPANFLTATYALEEVAGIQAGERVLIHAAAGGTGLAAVEVAHRAGAEVWGTAGRGKWGFLKERGVSEVMNSRTLEFAGEVMARSDGEGVDIVLNSLTGEAIPKSLSVLKRGGRFLEIGKSDVWDADRVSTINPDATYALIDLREMALRDADRVRGMLLGLFGRFERGELRVLPLRVFEAKEVLGAFRMMQQSRHIGKLVVRVRPAGVGEGLVRLRGDGSYLVVGGLGGLGLPVARWLHERGAGHIVLMGRGQPEGEAAEQLAELREAGAQLTIVRADVSDEGQVSRALREVDESLPPLRGIIQSAGVLDDGVLTQQSWVRFERVLAPKVRGSWHLHALTQGRTLDFFVLFSSAASLLGSQGQANHSAANAFLDALAAYRRARGMPGLSINWGAWSDIGAAARRDPEEQARRKGMGWIPPRQGIASLDALFRVSAAQAGVVAMDDWGTYLRSRPPSPFFAEFESAEGAAPEPEEGIVSTLEEAPPGERRAVLSAYVRAEIRKALGFEPAAAIDLRAGLFDLGMDSLTSVELRNALQSGLACSLSPNLTFDYPTAGALIDHLAEVLPIMADGAAAEEYPAAAAEGAPSSDANLDGQSVDELADLLDQELASIRKRKSP